MAIKPRLRLAYTKQLIIIILEGYASLSSHVNQYITICKYKWLYITLTVFIFAQRPHKQLTDFYSVIDNLINMDVTEQSRLNYTFRCW